MKALTILTYVTLCVATPIPNLESKLRSPMVISIVKNVETKEDFAEALDEIADALSDMSDVMHSNDVSAETIRNPEPYGHMQFIPGVTGDNYTMETNHNLQDTDENVPQNDKKNDDNANYLKKLEAIFEAANIESDDSENVDDSRVKATIDDDDASKEDSVRPADDNRKSEFILDELANSDSNGNKNVNVDSSKYNADIFTNLHDIEELLISRTGSSGTPQKSIKDVLVNVKHVGQFLEELYAAGTQFIQEPMSSARNGLADQLSGPSKNENTREFMKEVNEETIEICVNILENLLKIVHDTKRGTLD